MKRIVSLWIGMLLLPGVVLAQDPNPLPDRDVEVVQFGQNYTLEAGATVRDLVLFGGSATIHGEVQRDAVIIGGGVELSGTASVGGDVVVLGGGATVTAGATVDGDMVVVGGRFEGPPDFAPGGDLVIADTMFGGDLARMVPGVSVWMDRLMPWGTRGLLLGRLIVPDLVWIWVVVGILLAVFFGLNFVLDGPVRASIQPLAAKPLTTFLIGLLVLGLVGPVTFILTVSVIGIAIVPFLWTALAGAAALGGVAVSRWIGAMLVTETAPENRAQGARSLCLGFAVICVALMVPVLGLISWTSLGVLGLGATSMAVREGLRRENPVPPPLPQEGSAPVSENPVATASVADSLEQAPLVDLAAFPRATFLARTGAFLLDCLLVTLIYGLLGLGVGQWFATLLLVYHIALWTWKGTTVGGIILQMRLVRTDGRALGFTDALIRGLASIFSVAVVGLGFFWILKDAERQSWHDKIAGTYVVTVPRNRP